MSTVGPHVDVPAGGRSDAFVGSVGILNRMKYGLVHSPIAGLT